ncbi:MAG TPA: hypothetical protein VI300_15670 [Solirubrobacter sp.]
MPLPRCRFAALALPALLVFPAAASAEPFKDKVITGVHAHASQIKGTTQMYPTGDGSISIPVTLASTYTGDPAVAQTYATFLGTLPHGPELASLKVTVVPSSEVATDCGGQPSDGILACYGDSDQTMIVPGDQAAGSDISVDYVITHEYGHHIAAHRSNAPLNALDFGPKRWSSYELVCANTLDGKLAPADEGVNYLSNPGEAWAEAYARLVFPTEAWRFTPLLKPTQGSALAAMADITQPWTKRVTTTFTGSDTKTFTLPLTLDGAFTLKLDGPATANYDLIVRSGGKVEDRTTRPGSQDSINYKIACRDRRTENLKITVIRRSGGTAGPYTLTAKYAG